ncbi:hypothetical protein [Actinokineospora cianjurensis]|uniref:Uncharacterized protein n=1 Tax=Actinokineospora cianjurensis TaxID=585224 RepID=A0A421B2J9_9PSEU|nr:hypothetical protein [Actinokineospora cianjurensis]RLK58574.1 hypothetical protein CLV68_3045 [Actinokineospora cianjurensis]
MSQPPQDWEAVGRCIDQRLSELALTQSEMADALDRFRVDLAMILHNTRRDWQTSLLTHDEG